MSAFNFSHTKISFGRSIWSYAKVQVLVSTLIRGRKAFMNLKTEGLILDLTRDVGRTAIPETLTWTTIGGLASISAARSRESYR
jgi:hypothetical protein